MSSRLERSSGVKATRTLVTSVAPSRPAHERFAWPGMHRFAFSRPSLPLTSLSWLGTSFFFLATCRLDPAPPARSPINIHVLTHNTHLFINLPESLSPFLSRVSLNQITDQLFQKWVKIRLTLTSLSSDTSTLESRPPPE